MATCSILIWNRGRQQQRKTALRAVETGKLILQIEGWLERHPNAKLIIIDTIDRVKGSGRRSETAYESDIRTYGKLQNFAMERGFAIIGVHHYQKGVDDDED